MSSFNSSSQFFSDFFSPPYVISKYYKNRQIRNVKVYDIKTDNIGLTLMNARHCFCTLQLDNYQTVVVEATKNQQGEMEIRYGLLKQSILEKSRLLVEHDCIYESFEDLGEFLEQGYQNDKYDLVDNNCYHVCMSILNFFDESYQQVEDASKQQFIKGYSVAHGVVVGAACAGPVGALIGGATSWIMGNILYQ